MSKKRVFKVRKKFSGHRWWEQRDDIYRVVISLKAGEMKFRVSLPACIQLSRVFSHGKRLNSFYNSGCLLHPCWTATPEISILAYSIYII